MMGQFTEEQCDEIDKSLGECAMEFLNGESAQQVGYILENIRNCLFVDGNVDVLGHKLVSSTFAETVCDSINDIQESLECINSSNVFAQISFAINVLRVAEPVYDGALYVLENELDKCSRSKFGLILDIYGHELICTQAPYECINLCRQRLEHAVEITDETIQLAFDFTMAHMVDEMSVEAFTESLLDDYFNYPDEYWAGLPKPYIGEAYRYFLSDRIREEADRRKSKFGGFSSHDYNMPHVVVDPHVELTTSNVFDKIKKYLPLFKDWTVGYIDSCTQMRGEPPIIYAGYFDCFDWDEVWQRHRDGQYGLVRKESN